MNLRLPLFLLSFFICRNGFSQCAEGEISLTMSILTDPWGYEAYWELVPGENECGDGTVAMGGNANDIGCGGAGNQDATGNFGYPSNTIITTTEDICLVADSAYTLVYIDDWGDGGASFEIYENGSFSHAFIGGGTGSTWSFVAGASTLPSEDSPCGGFEIVPDGGVVEFIFLLLMLQ